MRKAIVLFTVLCCLLLAGCDKEVETVVTTAQPDVTQSPTPEPTPSPEAVIEEPNHEYSELLVQVQAIIADTEAKAAEQEAKGANLITQLEMNEHSYQLYMIWDDAINAVWRLFDEALDRDLFYTIQAEQIAWITEKETELQKIQDEYAGGSIVPLACNTKAAEMTKERIYELVEYIK